MSSMPAFSVRSVGGKDLRALAALLVTCAAGLFAPASSAQQEPLAVNHIVVDDRLHTSGQPQPAALETLAALGFDAVVNLAPPTARDAVAEERDLLESSGVAYTNIPVDFRNPTYQDFERFSEVLQQARDGQVLVHCQINARASTFTFLYRVVHEGAPPAAAFELVRQVWTPIEHWAEFAGMVLERHGIDFDVPREPAAR